MALNYKTYYAIPHLPTYADAKKHYDNVAPIRRDPNNTRPVGRRDQKWFNIWMEKDDVHVGYGWTPDGRHSLVSYQPGGTITLHKRNRWSSASDNERRQRLLGTDFRTHQYDTWVKCAWYDEGTRHTGYLPLRCNGKRGWDAPEQRSVFTRESDGTLAYLNYTYPAIHKPNNVRLKEKMEPFRPFLTFVEGLRKLGGQSYLHFSQETVAEFFGMGSYIDYKGERCEVANNPPSLWWGIDVEGKREEFLVWAQSDDSEDRMRAAISLHQNARSNFQGPSYMKAFFKDLIIRKDPKGLLDRHVAKSGGLVTDRCKRYILDAAI